MAQDGPRFPIIFMSINEILIFEFPRLLCCIVKVDCGTHVYVQSEVR